MELNHLRVFFEVAKIGSFTEAAKKLNISQSALSRSVALLEESEKVVLFERSKKGLSLTPLGEEVFRKCEDLFQVFGKIEEVCRGIRETCEGPLRLATADHIINHLLVQPIQSLRSDYPGVMPSIFTGSPDEIIEHLIKTECEFALLFTKISYPQLEYRQLREEPMALVVNADLWRELRAGNNEATLNKVLSKVGYIASIGATTHARPTRVLQELFGKMPPIGFEANGQEIQKRICMARGGVAYLSRFMVEQEIRSGILHEISIESPHVFALWLATKKGKVLSVQARTFIQRLEQAWGTKTN